MQIKLSTLTCARTALASVVVMLSLTESALAHHSYAMYDQAISTTMTGRLIRFIPGANHAQLLFELIGPDNETVIEEGNKPVVWGIETGPASRIALRGITVESFPLGTILTVTIHPLRNGKTFGAQERNSAIINCGLEIPEGGCTEETGNAYFDPRNF